MRSAVGDPSMKPTPHGPDGAGSIDASVQPSALCVMATRPRIVVPSSRMNVALESSSALSGSAASVSASAINERSGVRPGASINGAAPRNQVTLWPAAPEDDRPDEPPDAFDDASPGWHAIDNPRMLSPASAKRMKCIGRNLEAIEAGSMTHVADLAR